MRKLIVRIVGGLVALGLVVGGLGVSQTYAREAGSQQAVAATQAPKAARRHHRLARALAKETLVQTGLTKEELKAEIQAGKSLAQIASAYGSSEQAVVDAVLTKLSTRLDKAVAKGKITPEQKTAVLARAAERARTIMNKTR